jgi:hypothetical protein
MSVRDLHKALIAQRLLTANATLLSFVIPQLPNAFLVLQLVLLAQLNLTEIKHHVLLLPAFAVQEPASRSFLRLLAVLVLPQPNVIPILFATLLQINALIHLLTNHAITPLIVLPVMLTMDLAVAHPEAHRQLAQSYKPHWVLATHLL